ncbi:hypothetical protein GDO78_004925 [Eleutherodactylus coqui]|uniref:Uncharacterized protein n=1 Tax=Eleutherodactylus coqui TaxID=57060 RepID=A0A8J6FIZ9_ELECQ|nr:hypothetical protein GDO78_004925 [Eleutherodactylus coqui]
MSVVRSFQSSASSSFIYNLLQTILVFARTTILAFSQPACNHMPNLCMDKTLICFLGFRYTFQSMCSDRFSFLLGWILMCILTY